MKDSYVAYLLNKELDVQNTRMPYSTLTLPDGRRLYVSENKPLNPAMMVDFYQLTVCAAYLANDRQDDEATFNMYYRRNPFKGNYAMFFGLNKVIEFMKSIQYTGEDIDCLRKIYSKMPPILWEYLRAYRFTGTMEAVPEGCMIQPNIPLIQITDTLPSANIIETQLLTSTGYMTMVGTKCTRVHTQSNTPWSDFSLRGAPGYEVGIEATRVAYACGASGSSNVGAFQKYGIPTGGTMNHAYVMSYPTQLDAFLSYGRVFQEDSVFLIDTNHFKSGTYDAIKASKMLGLDTFKGTRDDSGDLDAHSNTVRKILDDHGLTKVKLTDSNEINEYKRRQSVLAGSQNDTDGIGRGLVTNLPDSGMVYKLVQLKPKHGTLRYAIKVSGDEIKITDPGRKQVFRFFANDKYIGDVITLDFENFPDHLRAINRQDGTRKSFDMNNSFHLLLPYIQKGDVVNCPNPSTPDELRQIVANELKVMEPKMKELDNDYKYFVGVSENLKSVKDHLLEEKKKENDKKDEKRS